MTKQYTVTVNGTAYEVTVESVSGGRMASAPVARTASAPVARAAAPVAAPAPAADMPVSAAFFPGTCPQSPAGPF
ncbi:MAG: acetyl-CoA carboxylase biotin carboxyl carrier protein subunit, partial [Oscillospiraceae bacterium]|nr:acetyl-CoA carboxylase biotin carboxyl carrier protein subunit [Oscillospiraceae bacterium]